MCEIGQQVHHGNSGHRGHAFEGRVREHTRREDRVEAAERARDVLDALAHIEADLVIADGDRMTSELDHCHLGRFASARRRLLEEQGSPAPRQHGWQYRPLRELEDERELLRVEVVDLEKVPHRALP